MKKASRTKEPGKTKMGQKKLYNQRRAVNAKHHQEGPTIIGKKRRRKTRGRR